ncbi:MAG: Bax inhibitor-1/YccA family protein [Deltaproteobacteria bacterium]|jgi:FtsH-binding integral membrane protein|nr:Bax inhibitor-1/YccA family protein [Deltaproteobacteria bacterium]
MQDFTNPYAPQSNIDPLVNEISEARFFRNIYLWMCLGLIAAAQVSYSLSVTYRGDWLFFLNNHRYAPIAILGGLVVVLLLMNASLGSLPIYLSRFLFLIFAALLGVSVSLTTMFYPSGVVYKAFFCTVTLYGGMAAYGLLTKRSLRGWGTFLFMALIGLIVAAVVNFFMKSPMVDYVICWAGVLVFAGLTAYDHQKLRVIFDGGFADERQEARAVIMGATSLLLDFVNMFLFIVRILGNRR